jgi:putative phage-type endonuclease
MKRPGAIRLKNTLEMNEKEWQDFRHNGIGGSDVSAILGLNKWKTKLQIYMEKTGQWEQDDLSDNQAVHFGNKLEQVVADEFSERTGLKVIKNNFVLQHPEHAFMFANIDREIIDPERGRGVLECKTTSAWNKDAWSDSEVPKEYMVQVQHYLSVTGYEFAYIAVLIGGNNYDHWLIERDEELIEILIDQERIFWNEHILAGMPPDINFRTDGDLMDRLYPAALSVNEALNLEGSRVTQVLNLLWGNEQEMKLLKSENDASKTELKEVLKENQEGIHD